MEQSPPLSPHAAPPPDRAGGLVAGLVLGGVFVALALPLMLWSPRVEYDEVEFHLPAVLRFAHDWPHFDFRSYTSATTPGYHLVLAAVAHYVSEDVRLLRVVGSLFTVGMLVMAGMAVGRRTGSVAAIALCLPLVFSPYVFRTGVWIIPQNAGWWGVLAVMVIALRPKVDWVTYLAGALVMAALVFVRQLHLWAAAVLWLAAWLGTEQSWDGGYADRADHQDIGARLRRAVLMCVATLPAFLIVGCFFKLWGGTLPAIYQRDAAARAGTGSIQGVNPAVPAVVLSLTALLGVFFLPFAWRRATTAVRADRRLVLLIIAAAVAGLLVGALPHTSYSFEAGRWSGIWNGARRLPTYADRSPLIITLSAAGGAMMALWFIALGQRERWIFVGSWVAFTFTQCFTSVAWQRYYEPFLLMLFPLLVARLAAQETEGVPGATHDAPPGRWRPSTLALAGPLVLAAGLAALTGMTIVNSVGLGIQQPATTTTAPDAAPAAADGTRDSAGA